MLLYSLVRLLNKLLLYTVIKVKLQEKTFMKRLFMFLVFTLLLNIGCSPYGYIVTNITKPLDVNMSRTLPENADKTVGDLKHFSYSLIDVSWGSYGIGDVARKNGIETIYYADLETVSIIGVWEQYIVHIYGR